MKTREKLLFAFMIAFLVFAVCISKFFQEQNTELKRIKIAVVNQERKIESLEFDIDDLESKIDYLESEQFDYDDRIDDIENRIDDLE